MVKIYDISQEVFSCCVFPGDPAPEREVLNTIEGGSLYNLTAFRMCAHNGTHVDAPFHFIRDGETVEALSLDRLIGYAYVAEHQGVVTGEDAAEILRKARQAGLDAHRRILIKGAAEVSEAAAKAFAAAEVYLIGNESQTVGPPQAPVAVHRILLGAGVILLEGIRLGQVPEGIYLLNAAPLNLAGADGAPCRAVLLEL